MSLLMNNTDALVQLRGCNRAQLEELFGTMAPVSGRVVGALYNADTEGMKNMLLHTNPAGVVAGLKIAALLTGASGAELVVRCEVDRQTLLANAGTVDLPLEIAQAALVNKALHKTDLLLNLEQLAAMADRLTGAQPGLLVAVGDATPTELPADTLLTEIVPAGKGLLADHRLYSTQQLEGMTLSSLASRSGVLRPMTDRDCPVDLAKKEMLTLRRQSCGKCTFCREGLYQLNEIFERISLGRAKAGDLDLAEEIGRAMTVSCNCTLGEEAALPALSAMDAFAAET